MSRVIDLSKYNTVSDFGAVANSVDGVIVRAGYRGYGSGKVVQDAKFVEFALACKEKGIPFGIYFMSQAINIAEAEEEAQFAATFADQYGATLPLFIDSEDGDGTPKVVRADGLSKEYRTAIVKAFCEKVSSCGKEAGVYASESWFKSNLDYDQIKQYKIWCAKYGTNDGTAQTSPALEKVDMWQYTSKGSISGIEGSVDLNECFLEIKSETPVQAIQTVVDKPKYIENDKVRQYQHAANIGFDLKGTKNELSEDKKFGPKTQNVAKTHLIYYNVTGCPTAVKWWQGIIGVTVDGKFGNKTLEATREWQSAHGLVADGVVGLATVTEAIK
ncbi:MAG: peptidoglycan-binding protein [Roseburia sp.]|nr:peptidoglycan-binding protein [Roseburia sp.]